MPKIEKSEGGVINRRPLRGAVEASSISTKISGISFPRTNNTTGSIASQDNRGEGRSSSNENWVELQGESPKVSNIRRIFGIRKCFLVLGPMAGTD
jgi:hypothetical protein